MAEPVSAADTRQRLLEAAGEVFAEQGFRATTVREICQRARANIAAVNYHFGDKEHLYAEVLRYAHRCAMDKYPPELGLPETAAATQRLRAFIQSFLLRIFDEGSPAWHGKLMAREMIEPTQALDTLVDTEIRPRAEQLAAIVRLLSGPQMSEDQVQMCAMSIVGQCVFYHHARPLIVRLNPAQRFTAQEVARLAEHITQFSLAALQHLARPGEGSSS
ncbi:MAG: CerR family C-terminal domain-containing protein [Candidatus Tectimicrobiota bacterium]